MTDTIIFLHGIARTSASMRKLADFFANKGYKTINVDYPSTKFQLSELVEFVRPTVERAAHDAEEGRLHFVGYSMGGLLIRALLKRYRPHNLGRVVMFGTPNHGSEVADFVKKWPLYRRFYGPAGQQLITDQTEIAALFDKVDYELGIIAGDRSIDPVSSAIIGFNRPNDGKVSVESTKLAGAAGHIVIPATHTFFPLNRTMWKQAASFLETGSFMTFGGSNRVKTRRRRRARSTTRI